MAWEQCATGNYTEGCYIRRRSPHLMLIILVDYRMFTGIVLDVYNGKTIKNEFKSLEDAKEWCDQSSNYCVKCGKIFENTVEVSEEVRELLDNCDVCTECCQAPLE